MDPSGQYADCQVANHDEHSHERDTATSHRNPVVLAQRLHARNQRGWRRVALHFTPSWFSTTMGTGIVSILLFNLPYNAPWLYHISIVVFCGNILLFTLCTLISVVRYATFPGLWTAMLHHPIQSLFLGTVPMGLATLVNMTVFVCVPAWGQAAVTLAWTLWWIDVVLSVACCCYLPFIIMYVHESDISKMTAAWLLPIVAPIVAAASGGIIAEILPNPQHALWTLITSYVLWGTGVPLAMVVLVMYFHRLTVHRLPPRELIVSVFLPLGPLGQGGFAIMRLGKVAMSVLDETKTLVPDAGRILYVVGFAVALVMWGYGLVWLFFAVASITRSRFPFNMGWWGFTFPLGVYAVSTTTIAKELPGLFFKVLGTVLSTAVIILWLGVSAGTVRGAWTGKMIVAPCAAAFEEKLVKREVERRLARKGTEMAALNV